MPPHRKQAVNVIKRGGEHLLSLIEGTLDIARIEAGKLTLNVKPMRFADFVHEMAGMFELQAAAKGLAFRFEAEGALPEVVRADEKRRAPDPDQPAGQRDQVHRAGPGACSACAMRARWRVIEIEDTGPGMRREELGADLRALRARQQRRASSAPGAGLGLTIAKMLTDLMGGELTRDAARRARARCSACALFLPEVHAAAVARAPAAAAAPRRGYEGARRKHPGGRQRGGRPRAAGAPAGAAGLRAAHGRQRPRRAGPAGRRPAAGRDADGPGHAGHRRLGNHPPRCARMDGCATRRSPSSRPMPSTRRWTTTPASGPRTSSSSRCATPNCSTGWSAQLRPALAQAAARPPRAGAPPAPALVLAARRSCCAPLQDAVQPGLLPRHPEPAGRRSRRRSPSARASPPPCASWRASSSSRP